ncbi:MAG TPA: 50S ribosomal protein L22 [Firmicutes bacterium]|nr:50S ribosomal protein L22 [Bacillota bacterium]
MKTHAKTKYIRISPFKLRRIAQVIKGEYLEDALSYLKFLPHRGADFLTKTIKSAAANAVQKKMKEEDLIVSNIIVDEGPTIKRFRPRAMGRATRIRKRTSHITVILDDKTKEE